MGEGIGTKSPDGRWYRVQPGDSLWRIAKQELGDPQRWEAIAERNRIRPPYTIFVGQAIRLPNPPIPTRRPGAAGGQRSMLPENLFRESEQGMCRIDDLPRSQTMAPTISRPHRTPGPSGLGEDAVGASGWLDLVTQPATHVIVPVEVNLSGSEILYRADTPQFTLTVKLTGSLKLTDPRAVGKLVFSKDAVAAEYEAPAKEGMAQIASGLKAKLSTPGGRARVGLVPKVSVAMSPHGLYAPAVKVEVEGVTLKVVAAPQPVKIQLENGMQAEGNMGFVAELTPRALPPPKPAPVRVPQPQTLPRPVPEKGIDWARWGKAAGAAVLVVGAVAATVYTFGAASPSLVPATAGATAAFGAVLLSTQTGGFEAQDGPSSLPPAKVNERL